MTKQATKSGTMRQEALRRTAFVASEMIGCAVELPVVMKTSSSCFCPAERRAFFAVSHYGRQAPPMDNFKGIGKVCASSSRELPVD